ncbi:hypothetical protein ACFLS8_04415 [Chloroflexota bacterium]
METRKQLIKQYLEWTAKFEAARNRVNKLLPPKVDIKPGVKVKPWVMTEEMLTEFSRLSDEMDQAWSNMQIICGKLNK